MIPSKSPYSSGWSSTWTARRLSAGLGDGPLGTAQDLSTPSISRRRSQWRRRAACMWTTKRPRGYWAARAAAAGAAGGAEAAGAARAPGSGVRSSARFARYALRGSGRLRFAPITLQSYHKHPMSAHSIGSATLSFGLVSVPVKMFSTGESAAAISFNWLHKKDGARLKQQYVCSKDGEKVEKDDMVKGYEFTKGQYVIFAPEELKALEEKATGAIEITEFVPGRQVDRVYLEKSYFLGPDKGGERAYRLLCEALKQTGRVAVGQYAARGKQYLISVRPLGDGLVMEQLRYASEVRSIAEVPIPKTELKKPELQLATQLIEQASSEALRPEAYEDNVRKRILEQIQRKVEGKEITEEPAAAGAALSASPRSALRARRAPSRCLPPSARWEVLGPRVRAG